MPHVLGVVAEIALRALGGQQTVLIGREQQTVVKPRFGASGMLWSVIEIKGRLIERVAVCAVFFGNQTAVAQ